MNTYKISNAELRSIEIIYGDSSYTEIFIDSCEEECDMNKKIKQIIRKSGGNSNNLYTIDNVDAIRNYIKNNENIFYKSNKTAKNIIMEMAFCQIYFKNYEEKCKDEQKMFINCKMLYNPILNTLPA